MIALGMLGALVVGAAFGYGAQRGAFCMNSGCRNALKGDWTRLKSLGLAVALQLLLLPAIFGAGLAHPSVLPIMPLAAVTGGVLFGLSMGWAGGCAAGVWYKLGAGDIGALLAILGLALGATATEIGPFTPLRALLQGSFPVDGSWGSAPHLSVGAGLILLLWLFRLPAGRAGAWPWSRTGLWIGVTGALAWPISAAAGRSFGLAIVPGATGFLPAIAGQPFPRWDVLLVLGVMGGGWLGARRAGPVRLIAPGPLTLFKRFAGGLGLGVGASIAAGCTVGQGLTGLALLAPGSLLVMGAIFGGSSLAVLMTGVNRRGVNPMSPSAIPGADLSSGILTLKRQVDSSS